MEHRRTGNDASPLNSFLEGVRILDLSQYIPGPMATLLLSDMGADVLKIEPPAGDPMEQLGPRDSEGEPVFYASLNAGKRICRINLKSDAGRDVFLELAREADVVVEGFRPGVMHRLGIDYSVLSHVNPRVILCSISGYGANANLAMRAGHDANYLAMMGVAHRNGSNAPMFYDPPLADSAGSLFAAITILGALQGRVRTGKGCAIDIALADTVMPLQMMQVAAASATGAVAQRNSYYLNGGAAYYQVYATADERHIVIGAVEPKFWANFCHAANRADLIHRQSDPMPQTRLINEVAEIFRRLTASEAESHFGSSDCCISVVDDLGNALSNPHIAERCLVAQGGDGVLQSLFPAWVDGVPPRIRELPMKLSLAETPVFPGDSPFQKSGQDRAEAAEER